MQTGALAERVKQNQRDLNLIERIRQKDQAALSLLYERYESLLYSLSLRIVNSGEESNDVIEEVFILVWTKADTYSLERGTVFSWIVALCRNKAIDRVRSKGFRHRQREIGLETIAGLPDHEPQNNPESLSLYGENRTLIVRGLKTLTKTETRILELSYYQGYSQSEISKMLKLPLGTVKTRMRQAIIKLRSFLHKPGS